ncbi:MAG TPA: hypothetical protein VNZ22_09925 [Bacillota bacterium]|nr:hypothetical protein [Bacillota bacterium]
MGHVKRNVLPSPRRDSTHTRPPAPVKEQPVALLAPLLFRQQIPHLLLAPSLPQCQWDVAHELCLPPRALHQHHRPFQGLQNTNPTLRCLSSVS